MVDAVLAAEIDGRPIDDIEAIGAVMLLVLGGWRPPPACWDGHAPLLRAPRDPRAPRAEPERIPTPSRSCCASTGRSSASAARPAATPSWRPAAVKAGERVIIYWRRPTRDEDEFEALDTVRPRPRRQPAHRLRRRAHRCAGSNLARMNLRIAFEEVDGWRRAPAAGAEIRYHSAMNRAPVSVPITCSPDPSLSTRNPIARRGRRTEPARPRGVSREEATGARRGSPRRLGGSARR